LENKLQKVTVEMVASRRTCVDRSFRSMQPHSNATHWRN